MSTVEQENEIITLEEDSLTAVTASLCDIMGIAPPKDALAKNEALVSYARGVFEGGCADKIFMYNPDAIGRWIYKKYPKLMRDLLEVVDVELPFTSVMPSVTPVNFATMYTGLTPEGHGIKQYEKPVLLVETIFDALIKAGKRPAIVAHNGCSVSKIFRERDMDYFTFRREAEVHAKVAELIVEGKYDFIAVHACDYDTIMHKFGPESVEALAELRVNSSAYRTFDSLIREHWKDSNVFLGFAMDHGCHLVGEDSGAHGLDMPEDLEITHFYKAYKAQSENS